VCCGRLVPNGAGLHGVKRPESCETRGDGEELHGRVNRDPRLRSLRVDAVAALSAGARREGSFPSLPASRSSASCWCVATLIIVMAVMNGFRKELLDKILGLNGHLLIQPLESRSPIGRSSRAHLAVEGVVLIAPWSRTGARRIALQRLRRSGARHARADLRAALDRRAHQAGLAAGFDSGQGIMIGRRLADQLSVRAGDGITLVAPRER